MPNISLRSKRVLTIICAVITLICWLAAGTLQRQINYMTRGVYQASQPIPPANAHLPTELGLVVDLGAYDAEALTENLTKIDQLGISKLRQTYYFAPNFDWSMPDQHFEAIAQFDGLQIIPLLDGSPSNNFAPVDPAEFATWAAEFAERYGETTDAYMIWDEPNITTHWGNGEINPQAYGALLSASSVAIKAKDPAAQIVLAPLAPTTENNLFNMSEAIFLGELYSAGVKDAFDIVAIKPYGFQHPPADREVSQAKLNFSRAILVRETMLAHDDASKQIWAGNWGWNSLPDNWGGSESPWGTVSAGDQIDYTIAGYQRAQSEWPWMSTMFLHHWNPPAQDESDPAVGYAISQLDDLSWLATLAHTDKNVALSGYYPATADLPFAQWIGDWRFSPEYGADMSQKSEGDDPDQVIVNFEGTEVALRVRRANYRARFNILIDGEPANQLPADDRTARYGSALVLNTNSPDEDQIETIVVASNLSPGTHQMVVTGHRGWDQWALKGFVVTDQPPTSHLKATQLVLRSLALLSAAVALFFASRAQLWAWLESAIPSPITDTFRWGVTGLAAVILTLSGWLTWGAAVEGMFRKLSDGSQIFVLFGTAIIFYVTPWLPVYLLALLVLFVMVYHRPTLGLVLITFSIPFYVPQLLKPIYVYRFSPVEIFTLVTFCAILLHIAGKQIKQLAAGEFKLDFQTNLADISVLGFVIVAFISLAFTERIDVATNELRTVIIGPAIYYWMLRVTPQNSKSIRWLLWAFIAGGVLVALIGLGQYALGTNLITAEQGLQRLRSIYGSPNNVALYLGRIYPILLALILTYFWHTRFTLSRLLHAWRPLALWGLITITILLTFSRGGILLGLPAGTALVWFSFLRKQNRPLWPWLTAGLVLIIGGYLAALQIPALVGRLSLGSQTAGFRINLWVSSLQIIQDRPLTGVGLDNFLYAYRNRYILARAWQEPNLNHPHNHVLDFATRLGLPGLLCAILLFWATLKQLLTHLRSARTPITWGLTAGLAGAIVYILAHGLVDHSFFLVDLAYSTFFLAALTPHVDALKG